MIENNEPLSIAEASEYIKGKENEEDKIRNFIKKFAKINVKKAKELRANLEQMEMMKIKPEHIVKIIDILPENVEELNKIFSGISLDEDETKKILEAVKSL